MSGRLTVVHDTDILFMGLPSFICIDVELRKYCCPPYNTYKLPHAIGESPSTNLCALLLERTRVGGSMFSMTCVPSPNNQLPLFFHIETYPS